MYFSLFFLFLFSTFTLLADWNRDFDLRSHKLIKEFSEFQSPEYLESYSCFLKARENLLKNDSLQNIIKISSFDDKFIMNSKLDDFIFKKRKSDNIKELFVYEVSHLLGGSQFFLPSFPVEIHERKVIVQQKESFIIGEDPLLMPTKEVLQLVSLSDFWKSHLILYILGGRDLVGRNIGVSDKGKLRFFDMENSFVYNSRKSDVANVVQFATQAFDWFHYRKPLDQKTAKDLCLFIRNLQGFENKIARYARYYRPLRFSKEGMFARLAKVRSFSFTSGKSFYDFYAFLYPERSVGLEKLNQIVSQIKGRKVDHGTSLCLISSRTAFSQLSEGNQKILKKWIEENLKSVH